VELIAEQTTNRELRGILKSVAGDVSAGFGLAQSFENKSGGKLPLTFIETVRSGEETGTLDTSFRKLHAYYDKSSKIKGKVKSAMVYPLFTCGVAVVVVAIIMIVAVPTFVSTFASMGITLPLPTKILIAISNFLTKFWPVIIAVIAAAGIAYKLYGRTEKGRINIARGKLRFPVLGRIAVTRNAAQFANTLSTLVAAGLPLVNAVGATGRTLDNHYIAVQIMNIVPKIEEGRSLGSALRTCQYIPGLLKEMTGVGEETGSLENTLDVIGAYYDNETEIKSAKALALMEPIIICILAVVVVFILLSVYLPIFSLYGGITG
jgi:type IV pilus assembly protein PilC